MAVKLTKQQQQTIVVAVMFLGGGLYVYWNYLLKPTLQRIDERRAKYADLVSKIERAEMQARRLPALEQDLERLKAELSTLEKQLPTDRDIPSVIRLITREAQTENIEFRSLNPIKATKETYFYVLGFDMALAAPLHNIVRFMTSLGQQERIFQFENLRLAPGAAAETGESKLNIGIRLKTYAYTG